MIHWKFNENVNIDLSEASLEAFDHFIKESFLTVFIDEEHIKILRDKFKKDYNLKD